MAFRGFVLLGILYEATLVLAQQASQPSGYDSIKTAHAVLGSLAWVFFFPFGAVVMRVLDSPSTVWVHTASQLLGYSLFIANVGTGIWMADTTDQLSSYHPVIGLVLFSLLPFQVVGGLAHHYLWVRRKIRTRIIAQSHLWLGRILITLGMINGGLGLKLAGDGTRGDYIAYGVVAGVVYLIYIVLVVVYEAKGYKDKKVPVSLNEKDEGDGAGVDANSANGAP